MFLELCRLTEVWHSRLLMAAPCQPLRLPLPLPHASDGPSGHDKPAHRQPPAASALLGAAETLLLRTAITAAQAGGHEPAGEGLGALLEAAAEGTDTPDSASTYARHHFHLQGQRCGRNRNGN